MLLDHTNKVMNVADDANMTMFANGTNTTMLESNTNIEMLEDSTDNTDKTAIFEDDYKPGTWKMYGKLKGHGRSDKFYQKPIVVTYTHHYNANSPSFVQNATNI